MKYQVTYENVNGRVGVPPKALWYSVAGLLYGPEEFDSKESAEEFLAVVKQEFEEKGVEGIETLRVDPITVETVEVAA